MFDPDRFPFLEGRRPGTSWRYAEARPLPAVDAQLVQRFQEEGLGDVLVVVRVQEVAQEVGAEVAAGPHVEKLPRTVSTPCFTWGYEGPGGVLG
jgi:hypothetical protein